MTDPAGFHIGSFPDWSLGFSARKIAYYSGDPAIIPQFTLSETTKFPDLADLSMHVEE